MSRIAEARHHLQQGRIVEAERAYRQALEQSPDNVEALNLLGVAALRLAEEDA